MKKIITIAAVLTIMAGALGGCGTNGSPAGEDVKSEKAKSSQTVATDGSTSMEKVHTIQQVPVRAYRQQRKEDVILDWQAVT